MNYVIKECPQPGCKDTLHRGGVNGQLLCCSSCGPMEIIEPLRVFEIGAYPPLTREALRELSHENR